MDKGRIMDNAQNNNARFVDQFGTSGKTSIKTHAPPGGKSSFSLGWSDNDNVPQQTQQKRNFGNLNQNQQSQPMMNNDYNNYNQQQPQLQYNNNYSNNQQQQQNPNAQKTSVRVRIFLFFYFFV